MLTCVLVAIVLIFAISVFFSRRKGTTYISGDFGFISHSNVQEAVHTTDREELRRVVERLLVGDIFDILWVSKNEDKYGGLMLTLYNGVPEMEASFKTVSEQEEIAAFREAMRIFELEWEEDDEGFNGNNRITSMDYTLPADPDRIVTVVTAALDHLQGEEGDRFYMTASLFAHGPKQEGGIKFSPFEDPLSQVL